MRSRAPPAAREPARRAGTRSALESALLGTGRADRRRRALFVELAGRLYARRHFLPDQVRAMDRSGREALRRAAKELVADATATRPAPVTGLGIQIGGRQSDQASWMAAIDVDPIAVTKPTPTPTGSPPACDCAYRRAGTKMVTVTQFGSDRVGTPLQGATSPRRPATSMRPPTVTAAFKHSCPRNRRKISGRMRWDPALPSRDCRLSW